MHRARIDDSVDPAPPKFPLRLLPGRYAVARLLPDAVVPPWADGPGLSSVTRTAEELSVVCDERRVPAGAKCESGWRAFQLLGPIPFGVTGVVSGLTAPLAAAGVGVFVLSTFDTDYLLVKDADLAKAMAALAAAGFGLR